MSATSFGGSFELTKTDDSTTRNIFQNQLIKAALHSQFTFLKYVPFAPAKHNPEMDEMIERIVSRRRKAMEAGEEKKDLLQIFMDTHDAHPDKYTVKHVTEEMRLFMFVGFSLRPLPCPFCYISILYLLMCLRIAGSDTTSTTATFTVFLLLSNPSKLKLLLSELDAAFPNMNDEITFAATQNLSYLSACINESMRLMPIVRTGMPRVADKATVLDGFEIPEGVRSP